MFNTTKVFMTICRDGVRRGCDWDFIKTTFIEYLDYLGDAEAYAIYNDALKGVNYE